MAKLKKQFEGTGDKQFLKKEIVGINAARLALTKIYECRLKCDNNRTRKDWYNPENHRSNNGFLAPQTLDAVENALTEIAMN